MRDAVFEVNLPSLLMRVSSMLLVWNPPSPLWSQPRDTASAIAICRGGREFEAGKGGNSMLFRPRRLLKKGLFFVVEEAASGFKPCCKINKTHFENLRKKPKLLEACKNRGFRLAKEHQNRVADWLTRAREYLTKYKSDYLKDAPLKQNWSKSNFRISCFWLWWCKFQ